MFKNKKKREQEEKIKIEAYISEIQAINQKHGYYLKPYIDKYGPSFEVHQIVKKA